MQTIGGPEATYMKMMEQQHQLQSHQREVRPGAVRQTSSMGETSGQRSSEVSGECANF